MDLRIPVARPPAQLVVLRRQLCVTPNHSMCGLEARVGIVTGEVPSAVRTCAAAGVERGGRRERRGAIRRSEDRWWENRITMGGTAHASRGHFQGQDGYGTGGSIRSRYVQISRLHRRRRRRRLGRAPRVENGTLRRGCLTSSCSTVRATCCLSNYLA